MVSLFRGVPLVLHWYSVGILGCSEWFSVVPPLFRGVLLFHRCSVFRCSVFRHFPGFIVCLLLVVYIDNLIYIKNCTVF